MRARAAQRVQVALARDEHIVLAAAVAGAGFDHRAQFLQPVAAQRRHRDRVFAIFAAFLDNAGRAAAEVGFVSHQTDRPVAAGFSQLGQRLRSFRGVVHHQQRQVGAPLRLARAAHAFGFNFIGGLAQAGGVGEFHRHAVQIYHLLQQVARGAGDAADDGARAARERVQQTGFAGVGRPGQRDF